jgi:hypothetical protein
VFNWTVDSDTEVYKCLQLVSSPPPRYIKIPYDTFNHPLC